ncbi:MAG: hypothetical protein AAF805_08010 [Planctomycetota bacterium]
MLACRPAEEIRTYRVAKSSATAPTAETPAPPAAAAPPAVEPTSGDPTHRMLAAIVPAGDQAWFFKAVARVEAMDDAREAIEDFYGSIQAGAERPRWETPDGWTEEPGAGMRLATLRVPTSGEPIELSVIGLPVRGGWEASVASNVDRWRGQMGLPTGGVEGVEPLGDGDNARLVDLIGWFNDGGMTRSAPFASKPPPNANPAAAPAPSGGLRHTPPDGWTDKPGSAMRKASLATPGGAEVTAFSFPNVPAMADPLSNVNRWRKELSLPPTTAEELAEAEQPVELLGEPGRYYELVGESATTLVAMTTRSNLVWFFKLRGPGEEAEAQRDAFREWLASAKLD